MPTVTNIHIPKPCHQQWQQMTNATGGRFCHNCQKTVTDFSVMSNEQIIQLLSGSNQVCGRFMPQQLTALTHQFELVTKAQHGFWTRALVAASVFWAVTAIKAEARTKPTVTQQTIKPVISHQHDGSDSTVTYCTLTGKITDEKNEPLSQVSIRINNTNTGAVTDINGDFRLIAPSTAKILTINFIGFESLSVPVNRQADYHYQIILKESRMLMGEVVIIKRPPFFKRLYYRAIRRPIKKIFG